MAGYKNRYYDDTKRDWAQGINSTLWGQKQENEHYLKKYGIDKTTNKDKINYGINVLKPMKRVVGADGQIRTVEYTTADPEVGDDGKILVNYDGRMQRVDPKLGFIQVDEEFVSEKIKMNDEMAEYLDNLVRVAIRGGDEVFEMLYPEAYQKAKTQGCLPSQLAVLPDESVAFSEKLWALRLLINKYKDSVVFNKFPTHLLEKKNISTLLRHELWWARFIR